MDRLGAEPHLRFVIRLRVGGLDHRQADRGARERDEDAGRRPAVRHGRQSAD